MFTEKSVIWHWCYWELSVPLRIPLHAESQDKTVLISCFSARAAVIPISNTTVWPFLCTSPYLPCWEDKPEFFSSSTKVESYSIFAGKGKRRAPVVKDWRFLCLSWLPCDSTVHEHWSNVHLRVYAGAWAGKSRYRDDPAASQVILHRGVKKIGQFLWWGVSL